MNEYMPSEVAVQIILSAGWLDAVAYYDPRPWWAFWRKRVAVTNREAWRFGVSERTDD